MEKILYEELSYSTLGAAIEVHRTLGPGFLEAVYEQALAHEFDLRQIHYQRQVPLAVLYKGVQMGEYRADFLIDGKIVLELKAASGFVPAHEAQAHHYLAATGFRVALLLNFGAKSLQIKRVIR